MFATSYYVVQRTCGARLISDRLAGFTFWGWQLVIVLAAISLPLGITSSKEYAELEWPIDILITLVWVSYAIVFFGTIMKRTIPHIYVANWFFGGFILTIAVLHVVNSAALPVSLYKSYSVYAGVQDAMVVRTQCRWLFSDSGFSWNHVLLCSQTSESACVFLSTFCGAFLGVNIYLHLGGASSLALYRITRLGSVIGHGVLVDSACTVLGRHD